VTASRKKAAEFILKLKARIIDPIRLGMRYSAFAAATELTERIEGFGFHREAPLVQP
jgi:hypothetical protein